MVCSGEEWQSINAHKTPHQYEIHLFKSMSKKEIKAHITLKTNQKPARHCLKCSTKPGSRKKEKKEIFDTSRLI